MLEETITVLAAAGGTAVVQAAGTDAWTSFRQAVASWFGRGDAGREQDVLERLVRTDTALAATSDTNGTERLRQEALWQGRFEARFEAMDEADRQAALADLRTLLSTLTISPGVVVGPVAGAGGVAVTGGIHAKDQAIAAGVFHGEVHHTVNPPPPAPTQG
ncbi:hypothetical protein [Embleya sp. NPDC005971]|uniref:hypothetical protein n=1 Tax=Embleya sp. NPDC005971 TaxID=3156724 RepID=UPI0033E03B1C